MQNAKCKITVCLRHDFEIGESDTIILHSAFSILHFIIKKGCTMQPFLVMTN